MQSSNKIYKNKSLLIGNSVNLLTTGHSWRNLLNELIKFVGKQEAIRFAMEKPFTLLYQEILIRAIRYTTHREKELKGKIIESLELIKHNDFHKEYMDVGFKNILTTNYDYNLEKSISFPFESDNVKRETKFNLFRRKKVNNQFVWHIHGEVDSPNSITLGYDHYVGYLSEMNKYLSSGTSTRKEKLLSPFKANLNDFENLGSPYSWIDIFLRDEIHIVGLSLDYTEIDLWWLITYKEKQMDRGRKIGKTHYYYFTVSEDELDNVARRKAAHQEKIKLSLLESYGVNLIPIEVNDNNYEKAHDKILRRLRF